MQRHMLGCWTRDFDKILFTYSKSKSLDWIYGWTCWQPAQFTGVGSLPSNRTQVEGSGLATTHISKQYFRPGGIALSEWTRSIRAVTDTPVVDYAARGVNTSCRVAYRPPIAVSQFLLGLSVFYFKLTLWWWRTTVTIRRNGFIGHAFASGLHCDGWRCENHPTRSFYLRTKCNSLLPNYTHHSKLPDLCGYWQSIARSVHLLSYYW